MRSQLTSTSEHELKSIRVEAGVADNANTADDEIAAVLPTQVWLWIIFPYLTSDELANMARFLPSLTLQYLNNDPQQVTTLIKFAELIREVVNAQMNEFMASPSNQVLQETLNNRTKYPEKIGFFQSANQSEHADTRVNLETDCQSDMKENGCIGLHYTTFEYK